MASSSKTMIIKGGDLSAAVKGGYFFSVLNPIFRLVFPAGSLIL